jgi:tetratricopeptide (TPR) repeat protein
MEGNMTHETSLTDSFTDLRRFVNNHNLQDGFQTADRILAADPGNIAAMLEKITLWFSAGLPELVIEEGEMIHQLAPGSAADLFAQAAAGENAPPDHALDLLDLALQLDPAFERAWYVRGQILYESSEYEDAAEALRQALALEPEHAMALFYLGFALHKLGKYLDAGASLVHYTQTPDFCNKTMVYTTLAQGYLRLAQQELTVMETRALQDW